MATLKKLAEQVRENLSAARQGSRYHMLEIIAVVGQTRDTAILVDYYRQINENDREIAPDLVSYAEEVEVQKEANSKTEFIQLPWRPLRFPRNAGLFKIAPMCDQFLDFIPTRPGDMSLLRNHPAGQTEGIPSYRVEGEKVKFNKSIRIKYPKLLVGIIRASDTFDEEEFLTLPPDMEEQIITRATEKLRQRLPEDKVIDNTDKL